MKITLAEIRKAQKWAAKSCKQNETTGRLEFNTTTGEFSMTEYTSSGEWAPMPNGCIAIPFTACQDDIDYAIGASSNAAYLRKLSESIDCRTAEILRKNGIEII